MASLTDKALFLVTQAYTPEALARIVDRDGEWITGALVPFWRTVMRRKYQVTRNRVQLQNRLEALLEEAHIKVSSVVSDLLGVSARRMLQALADGETKPAALATLAAPRLRATPEQLCDAFHASATLHPVYRRLLTLTLEELRMIEDHLGQLDQQMADLLTAHLPLIKASRLVDGRLSR